MAWKRESVLWDRIRENENKVPTCEEVSTSFYVLHCFPNQTEDFVPWRRGLTRPSSSSTIPAHQCRESSKCSVLWPGQSRLCGDIWNRDRQQREFSPSILSSILLVSRTVNKNGQAGKSHLKRLLSKKCGKKYTQKWSQKDYYSVYLPEQHNHTHYWFSWASLAYGKFVTFLVLFPQSFAVQNL